MVRATALALAALLIVASRSEATITLELRVDAEVRTDVAVHVAVKNVGDEDATDVIPEVTLVGATAHGDAPTPLATGYVAAWDLTLPRPSALGTLPLVVQLRYADAVGHRMSAPAVHVVRTAGTPSADVAIALDARFDTIERGSGTVRVTNHEAVPASGTLVLVGNEELTLVPSERTVEWPPARPSRCRSKSAIETRCPEALSHSGRPWRSRAARASRRWWRAPSFRSRSRRANPRGPGPWSRSPPARSSPRSRGGFDARWRRATSRARAPTAGVAPPEMG